MGGVRGLPGAGGVVTAATLIRGTVIDTFKTEGVEPALAERLADALHAKGLLPEHLLWGVIEEDLICGRIVTMTMQRRQAAEDEALKPEHAGRATVARQVYSGWHPVPIRERQAVDA